MEKEKKQKNLFASSVFQLSRTVTTHLYFGGGLLEECPSLFSGRAVVISDPKVGELYGAKLAEKLKAPLLLIPTGEKAKSFDVVGKLLDELLQLGVDRRTAVFAVGGGATMDLVGFVASICLRGLPLVLVPTTLLAMVDASIGGKTGINNRFGKNQIGTFYPPQAVVVDPDVLCTLSEKERLNGLAEIWKLGSVLDKKLWKSDDILEAIKGKIEVVEKDPMEQGLRRILNFGHTIGHALEKLTNYEISHGEAVLIGCVAEAHLSMNLGFLQKSDFQEIEAFYAQHLVQLPCSYTKEKLWEMMAYDKKKENGEVRFVLIDKIGHVVPFCGAYCRAVSLHELEETFFWLQTCKNR